MLLTRLRVRWFPGGCRLEGVECRFLTTIGSEAAAGRPGSRYAHAVRGQKIEPRGSHREQGVVGKFLRDDNRRRVLVLEFAAWRDADENESLVGRVQHSI